jgi:periplasmic divalent cation tolerance protein
MRIARSSLTFKADYILQLVNILKRKHANGSGANMTDKIIVFVTCETKEQATNIAEAVVKDKLAACVNVVPGIRSCYVWKKELTWSDETMLVIKTTRGRFEQLSDRVRTEHSYELPEIIAVEIEQADQRYLDWIDEHVGG